MTEKGKLRKPTLRELRHIILFDAIPSLPEEVLRKFAGVFFTELPDNRLDEFFDVEGLMDAIKIPADFPTIPDEDGEEITVWLGSLLLKHGDLPDLVSIKEKLDKDKDLTGMSDKEVDELLDKIINKWGKGYNNSTH